MKRVLTIILCGLLMLSVPACKPAPVTYPSAITQPGEEAAIEVDPSESDRQETANEEKTPEKNTVQIGSGTKEPKKDSAESQAPDAEAVTDAEKETDGEEKPAEKAPKNAFSEHPLAVAGAKISKNTASSLKTSGLVKNVSVDHLKDRTITLYTAGDTPAFRYTNEKGVVVSEWDWIKNLAAENGFSVKLVRKSNATSLKAQRIALYSGKDLSLISLREKQLAAGMTLCRSARGYLDQKAVSSGISSSVLKQSNQTFFAPLGAVEALWYNTALMPALSDPHTLYKNKQWTTEMYTNVHIEALSKKVMPLWMESALPWAPLSGRSPLTLLEGKLDSNINAKVTRAVWSDLQALNQDLTAFTSAEGTTYSLAAGNVAMAYTAIPAATENVTYSYAPLPTFEDGEEGTVSYCGSFLALPKYRKDKTADLAALTFAELWCNRYTESLAADLQSLGIEGEAYAEYLTLAEEQGSLIFYDESIETLAADYLAGLTDPKTDMAKEYEKIRSKLMGLIAKYNLNY